MSTQTVKNPVQIGSRLPNGATVIDFAVITGYFDAAGNWFRFGKCLAVRREDADPWVTWKFCINPQGQIVTTNGHYHDTLTSALEDFESRK